MDRANWVFHDLLTEKHYKLVAAVFTECWQLPWKHALSVFNTGCQLVLCLQKGHPPVLKTLLIGAHSLPFKQIRMTAALRNTPKLMHWQIFENMYFSLAYNFSFLSIVLWCKLFCKKAWGLQHCFLALSSCSFLLTFVTCMLSQHSLCSWQSPLHPEQPTIKSVHKTVASSYIYSKD